jgi:hypothetical protein
VIELDGRPGVFVASGPQPASNPPAAGAQSTMTAKFQPVQVGIRDGNQVEITGGIADGSQVITTGATALKDGDRIVAANTGRRGGQGAAAPEGGRQGSTR